MLSCFAAFFLNIIRLLWRGEFCQKYPKRTTFLFLHDKCFTYVSADGLDLGHSCCKNVELLVIGFCVYDIHYISLWGKFNRYGNSIKYQTKEYRPAG